MLDYSKYEVSLQLLSGDGEFMEYVPSEVSILPELPHAAFLKKTFIKQLQTFDLSKLYSRVKFSLLIRKKHLKQIDISNIYWKCFSTHIEKYCNEYDVAIGYGQGMSTMYVADKVIAKKKLAWINTCYSPKDSSKEFFRNIYSQIDTIVAVSSASRREFEKVYPEFKNKLTVIMDIINPSIITAWAKKINIVDKYSDKPTIISLSRLDRDTKGMDITLQTAKLLRDKEFNYIWHIFGNGGYHSCMMDFLHKNNLTDYVTLHSAVGNPYPFLSNATLYVQTSRKEGFGLAIAEARLLNIPIVATSTKGAEEQIISGKNGLLTTMDPNNISDTIISILTDSHLYNSIKSHLSMEKKGNIEELEKITAIIDR